MRKKKKEYLRQYLLQEPKLNRLYEMISVNPQRKEYYEGLIHESLALREEIERKINRVEDKVLVEILYNKYIFGKTLEETSYLINYSKRHTERLHIEALEKFKF